MWNYKKTVKLKLIVLNNMNIKKFEQFNPIDPYGEEVWDPVAEQEITSRYNIYLCTNDVGNFRHGHVYIIMYIGQDGNIITVNVKELGIGTRLFVLEYEPNRDPFRIAMAEGKMRFIGILDRERR